MRRWGGWEEAGVQVASDELVEKGTVALSETTTHWLLTVAGTCVECRHLHLLHLLPLLHLLHLLHLLQFLGLETPRQVLFLLLATALAGHRFFCVI